MSIDKYKKFFHEKQAVKDLLTDKMNSLSCRLDELTELKSDLNSALDIINMVSMICQDNIKGAIETIVTNAVQSVYGNNYSFEIDSKIQRGHPEIHMYVKIDDERYAIRNDELGGGVIDVVAFALRITLWAINADQSDNTMILDEPLKNLDDERMILIGEMIKQLSESLNLQFIIVTHETELAKTADASWWIHKQNNISIAERI